MFRFGNAQSIGKKIATRVNVKNSSVLSNQTRNQPAWTSPVDVSKYTPNKKVEEFLHTHIRLMQPDRVHIVDGSDAENEMLLQQLVNTGTLIKLNDEKRPNSYLARSPPSDVARVEERTFICTDTEEDAGFTNNWMDPTEINKELRNRYDGCMHGRTMYVIPFSMAPVGSPFAQVGIQITDSPYVVVNMRIMTRIGDKVLKNLGEKGDFVPCVHSVGQPLSRGQENSTWPSNASDKWIVHFPEQRRIFSYGSGYGGNALLGKKCLSLRIGSYIAREEGWLAEHCLIVGLENPEGVKKYFCAAFPSACGKTNLAMLRSTLPGWKVTCVGDDIAWLRVGKDGKLWAVNPEAGFFGVAPGTSMKSNPSAMETLKENVLFTNVALTDDGDVWWEGMDNKPDHATSWLKTDWYADSDFDAAHPNSRFTVSAAQCPVIDEHWERAEGVPIEGIIFGGRRSNTMPLVFQARNWEHGVFMGATMNSETTAAAAGKRGVLRNDPFAMRPFCGYNMADYFSHWATFQDKTEASKLPKIFHVNWFRKDEDGDFIWPGYGENIRVLEWIFNRCGETEVKADASAVETSIGFLPSKDALNFEGLDLPQNAYEQLMKINNEEWVAEVKRNRDFMHNFKDRTPQFIIDELDALEAKVSKKH